MAPRTMAAVLFALSAAAAASECASKVEGACSAPGEEVDTVSALQSRHFATALATEVREQSGFQEQCGDCDYESSECQNSGRQKCQMIADCDYPWPVVPDEMSCQHARNAADGCTCEPNNEACRATPGQVCWGFVQGTNCQQGSGPGCRQNPAQAGDFCWFSGSSNNFRYCPGTEPRTTTSVTTTPKVTTTSEATTTPEVTTTRKATTTTPEPVTTTTTCKSRCHYCEELCAGFSCGLTRHQCFRMCVTRWPKIKCSMDKYCKNCCDGGDCAAPMALAQGSGVSEEDLDARVERALVQEAAEDESEGAKGACRSKTYYCHDFCMGFFPDVGMYTQCSTVCLQKYDQLQEILEEYCHSGSCSAEEDGPFKALPSA